MYSALTTTCYLLCGLSLVVLATIAHSIEIDSYAHWVLLLVALVCFTKATITYNN